YIHNYLPVDDVNVVADAAAAAAAAAGK
ncbi:unnamed protein product, partial [Rotaria sp. Silwood2]